MITKLKLVNQRLRSKLKELSVSLDYALEKAHRKPVKP